MKVTQTANSSSIYANRLGERYGELSGSTTWHRWGVDSFVPAEPEGPVAYRPNFAERLSLAADPAHGGQVSKATLEEGAVGLWAESSGLVTSLQREATGGSEFVDGHGQKWDVKSPISPPPHQTWVFDANHQRELVEKELNGGENVLLNLSRCSPEDSRQVLEELKSNLTSIESQRVLVLMPTAR